MDDDSKIEWTETKMIDRGGRRVRVYHRKVTDRPGSQLRRQMAAQGKKWCRRCADWLPADQVGKNGLCRPHANEEYRERYAAGMDAAIRQRVHARRRDVEPVPLVGIESLTDEFGGECAYCGAPATTWDHIIPVAGGGRTEPNNIVPACMSCNSRKRSLSLEEFARRYPVDHLRLDRIIARMVVGG